MSPAVAPCPVRAFPCARAAVQIYNVSLLHAVCLCVLLCDGRSGQDPGSRVLTKHGLLLLGSFSEAGDLGLRRAAIFS